MTLETRMIQLLCLKMQEYANNKRCHWEEIDKMLKSKHGFENLSKTEMDYKQLSLLLNSIDELLEQPH